MDAFTQQAEVTCCRPTMTRLLTCRAGHTSGAGARARRAGRAPRPEPARHPAVGGARSPTGPHALLAPECSAFRHAAAHSRRRGRSGLRRPWRNWTLNARRCGAVRRSAGAVRPGPLRLFCVPACQSTTDSPAKSLVASSTAPTIEDADESASTRTGGYALAHASRVEGPLASPRAVACARPRPGRLRARGGARCRQSTKTRPFNFDHDVSMEFPAPAPITGKGYVSAYHTGGDVFASRLRCTGPIAWRGVREPACS